MNTVFDLMRHVQCRQPVLEHIESIEAVFSESSQTVWPIGLVSYFDVLLTVYAFYEKVQAQEARKARGDS